MHARVPKTLECPTGHKLQHSTYHRTNDHTLTVVVDERSRFQITVQRTYTRHRRSRAIGTIRPQQETLQKTCSVSTGALHPHMPHYPFPEADAETKRPNRKPSQPLRCKPSTYSPQMVHMVRIAVSLSYAQTGLLRIRTLGHRADCAWIHCSDPFTSPKVCTR